jgi:hypothetical protein
MAKDNFSCALDDDGAKCWGVSFSDSLRALEFPAFDYIFLNNLSLLTARAIKGAPTARASYLNEMQNFVRQNLLTSGRDASLLQSQYFALRLISTSLRTIDSDYFKPILATLQMSTRQIESDLKSVARIDIPDKDNLSKSIPVSVLNRRLALTSLQASLKISSEFLGPQDQMAVQSALRSVGIAKAQPLDNSQISKVVQDIESLASARAVLKLSPRAAFLEDIIAEATAWLKDAVK